MKKQEPLLKSDVRDEIVRSIDLWLGEANKAKGKMDSSSHFDWHHDMYFNDYLSLRAMAQALYISGKHLGVLDGSEYPEFENTAAE